MTEIYLQWPASSAQDPAQQLGSALHSPVSPTLMADVQ